jgi:hypothetical protein
LAFGGPDHVFAAKKSAREAASIHANNDYLFSVNEIRRDFPVTGNIPASTFR